MNTIEYDIDVENRTITGTYVFDRRQLILDKLQVVGLDKAVSGMLPDEDIVTIKAKAVCKDGDEYNEKYGKDLVESKIYAIKHWKIIRMLKMIYEKCENMCKKTKTIGDYHYAKYRKIEDDLKKYFNLTRSDVD